MIIGLTSGCFDLIHFGHIQYLERCKKLCDYLIVGVDCDEMVVKAKGRGRPIIPELERFAMVNSLSPVDIAYPLKNLTVLHEISVQFHVNKVFKHEGFKDLENVVGVTDTNAELVIIPDVSGLVSTSEILNRVFNLHKDKELL